MKPVNKTPNDPTYPLAYLEAHTWFYGRKFTITPSVLIPRPETEVIVDVVKNADFCSLSSFQKNSEDLTTPHSDGHPQSRRGQSDEPHNDDRKERSPEGRSSKSAPSLLDVGTGSGIIAITLALELPDSKITATDISEPALATARQNATLHHTDNITFLQSDLLQNLPPDSRFDIITANLPYVDSSWPWLDQSALGHEPPLALYADDHGLALIKRLITEVPAHLSPTGTLILEHDPCQFDELNAVAHAHNFKTHTHSPYVTSLTPCMLPASPPA